MKNPWGKINHSIISRSSEWNVVKEDIKEKYTDDMISFEDFYAHFEQLDFVHVNIDAYSSHKNQYLPKKLSCESIKWECKHIYGEFEMGLNAGGCGKHNRHDFWINPQYRINLVRKYSDRNLVCLIISLMQTEQVQRRVEFNNNFADSNVPIAFGLFKIKDDFHNKSRKFSQNELIKVFNDSNYVGHREISKRFDLEPGSYVLIPSIFEKDVAMKYFVRVFIR